MRWFLWRLELFELRAGRAGLEAGSGEFSSQDDGQGWSLAIRSPIGGVERAAVNTQRGIDAHNICQHGGARCPDGERLRDGRFCGGYGQGREWWGNEGWERESTTATSRASGKSFAVPPPAYEEPSRLASATAPLPPSYDEAARIVRVHRGPQEPQQRRSALSRGLRSASATLSSDKSRETRPPIYHSKNNDGRDTVSDIDVLAQESKHIERRRAMSDSRHGNVGEDTPPPPYRLFPDKQPKIHSGRVDPARLEEEYPSPPAYRRGKHELEAKRNREHELTRERGRQARSSDHHRTTNDTGAETPETTARPEPSKWNTRATRRGVINEVYRASDPSPVKAPKSRSNKSHSGQRCVRGTAEQELNGCTGENTCGRRRFYLAAVTAERRWFLGRYYHDGAVAQAAGGFVPTR